MASDRPTSWWVSKDISRQYGIYRGLASAEDCLFLSENFRDHRIRITLSEELYSEEGVLTGGVLVVTCFGLNINDLPSCTTRVTFRALFVDDLALTRFVLNNILILGIWCSTIPHIPGWFCPGTFFENIGFNTVLTDPFMSHLATQLGYSAGEFQALQLILVSWINHLPPACWSTFWKSNFKQQLGCRFDIMDNESYFFVFWHMQLYTSWYIRSFFGFTFLNILYFFKYSCTNIVHRRSLYTLFYYVFVGAPWTP